MTTPTSQAAATCRENFITAMDDDFNTGGAIGELFELAHHHQQIRATTTTSKTKAKPTPPPSPRSPSLLTTLKELANILGIFLQPPAAAAGTDDLLAKLMPLVIDLRATARKNKNFAVADKIRDGLAPIGIVLEDRAGGTEWSTTTTSGESGSSDPDASARTNALMQLLIQLRADARAAKDFATGDTIRNRLTEIGITLEDRAGGTEWTKT